MSGKLNHSRVKISIIHRRKRKRMVVNTIDYGKTDYGEFTVKDIDRERQKELFRQNRAVFFGSPPDGSARFDKLLDDIQEASGLKDEDLAHLRQDEIGDVMIAIYKAWQGFDKKKV